MTEVDLSALRKPFAPELIGKLPRVTCGECSDRRKQCTKHNKVKCGICLAYVSERHIHIDYVGHADVTSRLLETDPEWGWDFRSKDADPAVLAAAAATGSPEIVQAVLDNAPPKFDLDGNGDPVGLWITLTVGGVTRPGYGSVPSGQPDAVKVLIGDALRNAAMRFGVALDLWAKGDRADPTAENATASAGSASRGRPAADTSGSAAPARPSGQRGQVSRPERQQRPAANVDEQAFQDWTSKVDEIASPEDADRADAELREVFDGGRMNAATANAIRRAIQVKKKQVAQHANGELAGAR